MDKEWHSRNMKYGEGWAYDSSRSHYKRAKPTGTDPEDDRRADCPRQRRMIRRMITPCGRGRIAVSIGSKLSHQEANGGLDFDQTKRYPV